MRSRVFLQHIRQSRCSLERHLLQECSAKCAADFLQATWSVAVTLMAVNAAGAGEFFLPLDEGRGMFLQRGDGEICSDGLPHGVIAGESRAVLLAKTTCRLAVLDGHVHRERHAD